MQFVQQEFQLRKQKTFFKVAYNHHYPVEARHLDIR